MKPEFLLFITLGEYGQFFLALPPPSLLPTSLLSALAPPFHLQYGSPVDQRLHPDGQSKRLCDVCGPAAPGLEEPPIPPRLPGLLHPGQPSSLPICPRPARYTTSH